MDKHSKLGLNIAHINIQSLLPKTDQVCFIMHDNNIHILCITETMFDDTVSNNELSVEGFSLLRNDRGVILLGRDSDETGRFRLDWILIKRDLFK